MVYLIFKTYQIHVSPVLNPVDSQIIAFNFSVVGNSTCHTLTSAYMLPVTPGKHSLVSKDKNIYLG